MHKNVLWGMITVLLVTNALTFALLKKDNIQSDSVEVSGVELQQVVASVGEENITYGQFFKELELAYGKKVLQELINKSVIKQVADAENITISEEEIDREIKMITAFSHVEGPELKSDQVWREEIEYTLLLEELLTKDVTIPEEELRNYYNENRELFNVPTMYGVSHVIVSSLEEAETVIRELENGSSFEAIAMERSKDEVTSIQGGQLGYVSKDDQSLSKEYLETVTKLEVGEWSDPLQHDDGFSIVYLNDKKAGTEYSFQEVESQIRRQLGMQEVNGPQSVQPFWSEVGVEWKYSEEQND